MNTIRIKWSGLTSSQRQQVAKFHEEDVRDRKMALNQLTYRVNPTSGNVIFFKDF